MTTDQKLDLILKKLTTLEEAVEAIGSDTDEIRGDIDDLRRSVDKLGLDDIANQITWATNELVSAEQRRDLQEIRMSLRRVS